MKIMIISAAHDRSLSLMRHDERERRPLNFSPVHRNSIGKRHIHEHAAQPIIGHRGHQIRNNSKFGAGKGCRNRIPSKRHGVIARHRFLISCRDAISEEGDVNIGLTNEKGLQLRHSTPRWLCLPSRLNCGLTNVKPTKLTFRSSLSQLRTSSNERQKSPWLMHGSVGCVVI